MPQCVICHSQEYNFPGDFYIIGDPQEFEVCWRCFEEIREMLPAGRFFRRAEIWTPQYPKMVIVKDF